MKRITFLLFCILLLGIRCEAQSQYSAVIAKMENSLFGIDYTNQSDETRLQRIEKTVYGTTSSNPITQRIDKLSKDLSADVMGQEIKPKKDTFAQDDDDYKEIIPKADSSVNYPIVNNLEKAVFNKEFKTNDINQRLSQLEEKVFQKTYNDDLTSRVDRLKSAIMPERTANQNYNDEDNYDLYDDSNAQAPLSPENAEQTPSYIPQNNYYSQENPDILIPLASMEKSILKKSFPNDTTSNRLTRLELSIFNSTFTDDDAQTRLDRIASAYQAKKTSRKYDNNKFAQHAATAMQVGAILLMILAAIL